jgi:hypothetical protein
VKHRGPTASLLPAAEAARLRREAELAEPSRRAYLLWLADEWEKCAARDGESYAPSRRSDG